MVLSPPKALDIVRRSLTPNRPYHAQWLLTRRCNYRCRGCSVWRGAEDDRELSTGEVKRGLDILRRLGVVEIVFSGGNPLLRGDVGEILDYASRYFVTTVYDNGSMAAERIEDLRSVDFVAISLDTLDEEMGDYVKGVPGAWRRAVEAVEALQGEGIPVGISPTISRFNLNGIVGFTRHFTDRGIPVWYCLYWYDPPTENGLFAIGERNDEFEIVDGKAAAKVCDALMEMKRDREGVYITTKTLEALKQLFLHERRTWTCRALQGFLMVDHLGRVAGCHCCEPVASVFELLDVWDSPRFERLRMEYNRCDRCAYLCYIFYSLHAGPRGNVEILRDRWRSARSILTRARNAHSAEAV